MVQGRSVWYVWWVDEVGGGVGWLWLVLVGTTVGISTILSRHIFHLFPAISPPFSSRHFVFHVTSGELLTGGWKRILLTSMDSTNIQFAKEWQYLSSAVCAKQVLDRAGNSFSGNSRAHAHYFCDLRCNGLS